MARLIVTEPEQDSESPFLRGILTRSLQEAGLSFKQAYKLSSEIRHDLLAGAASDSDSEHIKITARQLQARVIRRLREPDMKSVLDRYRSRRSSASAAPVTVQHRDGHVTPFSRAHHQRGLQSCGLSSEESAPITIELYQQLLDGNQQVVHSIEVDTLTHELLDARLGHVVARKYLIWRDFVLSGRPLLLLIGGTAGCGKSTVATTVASRLEVVRSQSTDMLREVMRVMVPERLLPALHTSSFDAWRVLPRAEDVTRVPDDLLADGFRAQADLISVACEAVIQRAIRERVSLILEGVHVQPSLTDGIPTDNDALIVPIMLGALNAKTLRARIRGRGREVPGRRSVRYLEAFDAIWRLQSYLLSEADRAGTPIVRNNDVDQVFREVMRIILDRLSEDFSREPDEVFAQNRPLPLHAAQS